MDTNKIYAESIAKDYAPKENSKIVALKKLDAKAKHPSKVFAWVFGVVCSLVAGTGMCLAMEVIGSGMPTIATGIVVGVLGFTGCGINYPIYKKIREKNKAKYAFEIIELARQISEQ